MYLEKPFPAEDDDYYDLVCFQEDEALGLITLYVEPHIIHQTKDNKSAKQIWNAFHNLFGTVNTIQINILETELSNLKIADFASVDKYIAMFMNLNTDILTSGGQGKRTLNISVLF